MNEELVSALKLVLANTYVYYHKAHGYHWNVEGDDFTQYHELFSKIYEDAYDSVDDIAENIRKLGEYAPYKMARMVELATIPETDVTSDPQAMCADLLAANQIVNDSVLVAFKAATAVNEQGIANFLADRDGMFKKWGWQLRASLKG